MWASVAVVLALAGYLGWVVSVAHDLAVQRAAKVPISDQWLHFQAIWVVLSALAIVCFGLHWLTGGGAEDLPHVTYSDLRPEIQRISRERPQ